MEIDIYTSPLCGFCTVAKNLLIKKGLDFKNEDLYLNNTIKIGSHAYHSETFEFGKGTENTGLYTSLEKASDGGWRDHSEGKVSNQSE